MLDVRQTFHEELAILEEQLLKMGALASRMVSDAVESLQRSDVPLAESVIAQDDVVDALDLEIETLCMRLLALQQPMARDLRQIGTALKVITDLERIGDHAVDIAKISRKMATRLFISRPLVDVGPLAAMVQQMLSQSLEALIRHDVQLAHKICLADDQVDNEFKSIREQLFGVTMSDALLIGPASYMLLAAVSLERIADHTTNIAERINYIETGHLLQLTRSHHQRKAEAT